MSRISALEEKVALLEMGVASPKAVIGREEPVASSTQEAEDIQDHSTEDVPQEDPPFVSGEDDPDDADADNVSDPNVNADVVSMFGDVSSPDDGYTEIQDPLALAEKLGSDGEMYRTYITNARIETNSAGDAVRLSVDNPFAKTFLGTPQAVEIIQKAAMLSKIVSSVPRIEIVLSKERKSQNDDKFLF